MPGPDAPPVGARERFTLTPGAYRVVVAVALALLAIIVVTGAAVRLTGSGLGCEDWPNCSNEQFIAASNLNQAIEQVNRLFTGLVSLSVIAAVLGSLRRRPYRRDLVWWSWGLVAGVVGQVVLGGITVLLSLNPYVVAAHFVLSQILVANAVILLWRNGRPPGPRAPVVDRADLVLSRVAVGFAALMMFTGPAVTGSGPHAGDERAERFGWFIPDVTRIHSINMWLFLATLVIVLVRLGRRGAPAGVLRRGSALLVAIVAQGAIGYTQYELGIPAWLVAFHIAGATLVVGLTVWWHLGLSAPVDRAQLDDPDRPAATTGATA
ncbi:MAG: COX15/CtaA family protein [Microthrixaceae bacterium]